MPPPVLLAPAAGAALKAAAYEYGPVVTSATLAAVLARVAWKQVPEWIRNDVSFQSSSKELEGLSSVIEKLQRLADAASKQLSMPVEYPYASLLAYIKLAGQVLQEERLDRYSEAGSPLHLKKVQVRMYQKALEWSNLAYYIHKEDHVASELEKDGFGLLDCFIPSQPGRVGYFVASSKTSLLIAIRGTSSLEEVLTDTCGRSISCVLDVDSTSVEVRGRIEDEIVCDTDDLEIVSGHERVLLEEQDGHVRCHEGILIAARRVLQKVAPLVHQMVVEGSRDLILTGHSLGGSAACLLGLLLRSQFPTLQQQVYAIAPPPVLDHDSALAASSYCTSLVFGADLIARSSLANVAVLLHVLRVVSARLREHKLVPTGPKTTAAFLQYLLKNKDPIMTREEIEAALEEGYNQVEVRHEDHLYVPGRVIFMYSDQSVDENKATKKSKEASSPDDKCMVYVRDTTGTSTILRRFELDGFRMLGDHTIVAYSSALERLQKESEEVHLTTK